jgi:imidazolonepropionase-like amidohydrolase
VKSAARLRIAAAGAALLLLAACRTPAAPAELALVGGRAYPSPDSSPIDDAAIVVRNGRIDAIGPRGDIEVPANTPTIDTTGLVLVAGFQNSHVHFTPPGWTIAPDAPAAALAERLQAMTTRWGFTTVVDTGSDPATTLALRQRIESGELAGPRILTAGIPLYPPDGIPYYVRETVPPEVIALLHQPDTPDAAARIIGAAAASDILKLFTGAWIDRRTVTPMPRAVAEAAARHAHSLNKLVFAHASNLAGLNVALDAGVDVLAHALDNPDGFTREHLARMRRQDVAVVPTLKLFGGADRIVEWVRDFATAGGPVLFGTDVGFLEDLDPTEEYVQLGFAGLGSTGILASLTTTPAARFGEGDRRGRLAPGLDADILVLGNDPAANVRAFADVRYTIRGGRIVYRRQ